MPVLSILSRESEQRKKTYVSKMFFNFFWGIAAFLAKKQIQIRHHGGQNGIRRINAIHLRNFAELRGLLENFPNCCVHELVKRGLEKGVAPFPVGQ